MNAMRVRVTEVVRETADAHSLVLEPMDGRFEYLPGQFLTVRIPSTEDSVARCYSLCSSPHCDEPARITVKRTAGGYGSNWLVDNAVEGTVLEVLRPSGTFTPRSLDADVLLLAAGSGITPVLSILKSCLRAGSGHVTLVYANRDERSVIFRDDLLRLAKEHPDRLTVLHWLESVQGLPAEAGLRALTAPYRDREAFLCGPGPFMDLASTVLNGLGVESVTVERFTSITGDPFAAVAVDESGPASTVEVELDGETRTLRWPRENALLDVLLAAGLDAPFSCREGACSACACVLVRGEVDLAHNEVLDDRDLADGLILACQARPRTDEVKVTYEAS